MGCKVEDEGQMDDLLGIEIKYNSNGSITLHQQTYIEKVVAEFLPNWGSKGYKRQHTLLSKPRQNRMERHSS